MKPEHQYVAERRQLVPELKSHRNRGKRLSVRPFVLRFKAFDGQYVYDVNSNTIIRVNAVEFAIVKDLGVLSEDAIVERYRCRHGEDAIRDAHRRMLDARDSCGYFLSNRPSKIVYPLDAASLARFYDSRIGSVILELTQACNLRCDYCPFSGTYEEYRRHSPLRMSWNTAQQAIDFARAHSLECDRISVAFYGGEPLIEKELVAKIIKYANTVFDRKPIQYQITTNGTLLTEEFSELLISEDVLITVSLDGPAVVHDRYRRDQMGCGTFSRIRDNLAALYALNPEYYRANVVFNVVIAPPFDLLAIDEFVRSSHLTRDNRIRASFLVDKSTSFFDQFDENELTDEPVRALKRRFENAMVAGDVPSREPLGRTGLAFPIFQSELTKLAKRLGRTEQLPSVFHPGGVCIPGVQRLMVTASGMFYPCEKADSAQNLLSLGAVGIGLSASRGATMLAECSSTHDDCRFCVASRFCDVCFVSSSYRGRFDGKAKARECARVRRNLKANLSMMTSILARNPKALDYVNQVWVVE